MISTNYGTQLRTNSLSGAPALRSAAASVTIEPSSLPAVSAPAADVMQYSSGPFPNYQGVSMAAPSIAGLAALISSGLAEKEEYVPRTTGGVNPELENQIGAKLEESRAYTRLATQLKEKFSVNAEQLERVSVSKDEFPTRDMGLYDGGFGDISTSTRARSVFMKSETHNFLLREGLEVDKSTLAVWERGKPMPDLWERDLERGTLFAAGMSPVPSSPTSESRTGLLA